MREWVIWAGALALAVTFWQWLKAQRRYRKEEEVLRRKYGDLPMFEDFFRRLQEERRERKGRVF